MGDAEWLGLEFDYRRVIRILSDARDEAVTSSTPHDPPGRTRYDEDPARTGPAGSTELRNTARLRCHRRNIRAGPEGVNPVRFDSICLNSSTYVPACPIGNQQCGDSADRGARLLPRSKTRDCGEERARVLLGGL